MRMIPTSLTGMVGAAIGLALPRPAHAQAEWWRFESTTFQDNVGVACSFVPDLDGDGRPDVIVGANGTTCVSLFDGKAYLLSGATGAKLDSWCGSGKDDAFGSRVVWVHDVDGGGLPDLVATGPGYNEPTLGSRTGRVLLISSETRQPLWQLVGEGPGDFFGATLANAGDLDGDGFDEVVTSAINYYSFGRVYVVSSRNAQMLRAHDGYPYDDLGGAVAVLDDCDGDGIRDYAASFRYTSSWSNADGRVEVWSGATGNSIRSWTGLTNEELGLYLGSAGDWDGDGLGDLMCRLYDSTKKMNETVRIYAPATGAVLDEIADPDAKYSAFGSALGVVGDMDGDGHLEYAIGAYSHRHNGNRVSGVVYLYSGRTHRRLYEFLPDYLPCNFGTALAGDVDLTGDGVPDLLIGAHVARNTQPKGGRLTAFVGNDLWLQADPAEAAVGDTVVAELRNGEPNLLGLIVLTDVNGAATFDSLLLAPFDANGELQLTATTDASVSGMEFTILGFAQNRNGRGPLMDSSPFVVTVQ